MRSKKWQSWIKNDNGSTLAEVIVSFAVLLLASQLLLQGIVMVRKMEKRGAELSAQADCIRENIMDEEMCIHGMLRMELESGEVLLQDGWLYHSEEGNSYKIEAVRIENN